MNGSSRSSYYGYWAWLWVLASTLAVFAPNDARAGAFTFASEANDVAIIIVKNTNQTTPDDGAVDVQDTAVTSITHNVTSAIDDLVISGVAVANNGDPTFVEGASQTARFDGGGVGSSHSRWLFGTTEAGAGSVTMSHSWTPSEDPIQRSFNINATSGLSAGALRRKRGSSQAF